MLLTVANQLDIRHLSGMTQNPYYNARYKDVSDETLMLDYGRDNATAFDELYHRNKARLYRYFLRQTNQASLAEEFSHEVWLRIINARKNYQVKSKFSTYLFQIAHNYLVDYFRKASTSQEVDCDENYIHSTADNGANDPDVVLDKQRARQTLLQLIKQLPPEQRDVFVLKEEGNLSIDDIAGIICENPETIKSRLRYAQRKLRDGMQAFLGK